jgi:hypothetical protein
MSEGELPTTITVHKGEVTFHVGDNAAGDFRLPTIGKPGKEKFAKKSDGKSVDEKSDAKDRNIESGRGRKANQAGGDFMNAGSDEQSKFNRKKRDEDK